MTSADKESSILVVDDTPENLTTLRQILTDHQYVVRPAISGEVALRAVKAELPDLILLDIVMPQMDGYEVCNLLKSDEHKRHIPIIFISALDETVDKVKAFSLGAVDYITKPFQVEEVLARVHTHISMSKLRRSLEEKNAQLQQALDELKTLRGIIPICSHCKNVRDDKGYWNQVEVYIRNHSEAEFSHSICPECVNQFYPELLKAGY
jgi:PleD family two-component response regulator